MGISFNKLCSNLIPMGKYKAQITNIHFKNDTSKDLAVTYTIVDGGYAKKTLVDTIFEKSFSFRLKPFLLACGVDVNREFPTNEELYAFGLKEAQNKIIMVDIGIRTYNGNEFNQVQNWAPIPGSTTTAEDVLADFGVNPEVKGMAVSDLDAITDPTDVPVSDAEPELDLSDVNPF